MSQNSCLDNSEYYCNRLQSAQMEDSFPLKSDINCENGLRVFGGELEISMFDMRNYNTSNLPV